MNIDFRQLYLKLTICDQSLNYKMIGNENIQLYSALSQHLISARVSLVLCL